MAEMDDERMEARLRAALRTEARDNAVTITGARILARRTAPRTTARRGHPALRILGLAAAIVTLGVAGAVVLDQVQVQPPATDVAVVLRPDAAGSTAVSLMGPDGVDRPLRTMDTPGLKVVNGTWSVSPTGWVALGRPPFAEVTLIDLAMPDHRLTLGHTEAVTFGPDGRAWVASSRLGNDLWILDPATDQRTTIRGSAGRESHLVTADGHGLLQGSGAYQRRRDVSGWEVLREDGTTSVPAPIARYDVRHVISSTGGPLVVCGWDHSGAFNDAPECTYRVFTVATAPYLRDPGTVWYGPAPDGEQAVSAQWDGDGAVWVVVEFAVDETWVAELRHLPAPGEQETVLRFDSIGPMSLPAFSRDGRLVAFQSEGLDTDPPRAIVGDLETGATFRVDGIVGGFISPEVAARLLAGQPEGSSAEGQ